MRMGHETSPKHKSRKKKTINTRQHRKALWRNGCPSHNLLRHLTLTHDHDNKRGERMQE